MKAKSQFISTFYWWVIAAAFIGPGTVTTAARAGATSGYDLVWAVVFSVLACMVLQEASARVSIVTGKPLARVMGEQLGKWVMILVALSVGLGCLAYEAGNVTGAASGIGLLGTVDRTLVIIAISVAAAVLLWFGTIQVIARWLGFVVLLMGICFMISAFVIFNSPEAFLIGLVRPTIPEGGIVNVIGLIGTTIVPYALFLGSGIAKGRQVPEMRQGTIISVAIGGLITMSILITGTAVVESFSFENLSLAISSTSGSVFAHLFSLGLFAAGFTSAITAPAALGIVVESVWPSVSTQGIRLVRIFVVLVGMIVALTNIQPVAIIVAAQALNGILLPLTAITIALVLQRKELRSMPYASGVFGTTVLWIAVGVSFILGLTAFFRIIMA
jgi:Mn2+/Fe2+ NRAMP family transporter